MSGFFYRLEFVDPTMKETNMENLSTANENNMASSNSLQVCVCVQSKTVDKSCKFHISVFLVLSY